MYEDHFENSRERAIVISDLIQQIIQVEEVIERHRRAGTKGLQFEQYVARRQEFSDALNQQLRPTV